MIDESELHADVHELLGRVLKDVTFEGAGELRAQIPHARVTGGVMSMLDLEVDPSAAPAAACTDGPLPVQAVVEVDGAPLGFVLVWVHDGYLSGLESAWVTDEPPRRLFPPNRIRIEPTAR